MELRPTKVNGEPFWFPRVVTVPDVLDLERSKIRYLSADSIAAVEIPHHARRHERRRPPA